MDSEQATFISDTINATMCNAGVEVANGTKGCCVGFGEGQKAVNGQCDIQTKSCNQTFADDTDSTVGSAG